MLGLQVSEFLPAMPKSEENRTQAVGKEKKKKKSHQKIRLEYKKAGLEKGF